jgi:hypothetical protein
MRKVLCVTFFFRAKYLASCAAASGNSNIKYDAPLVAVIGQLAAYNISSAYDFRGIIDQLDHRLAQMQSAVNARSSLSLEAALDSYSNYGRQVSSYLSLVNQLSGVSCFWGNISSCSTCQRCTSLSERMDFQFKYNELIDVQDSIVAIHECIRLQAAALADFVRAAQSDQTTLQNFRTEVLSQIQQSSESIRSVSTFLKTEWECRGANDALPDYSSFKSLLCGIGSKSAASVVHVSCTSVLRNLRVCS